MKNEYYTEHIITTWKDKSSKKSYHWNIALIVGWSIFVMLFLHYVQVIVPTNIAGSFVLGAVWFGVCTQLYKGIVDNQPKVKEVKR